MKEQEFPTPHDDFFKVIFEQKEKAAAFIQAGLPKQIVAKLNLETLRKMDVAFSDRDLGNFRADVIYQCDYGDERKVLVSLLFEHKSYIPRYPHLQLLKYMLGIWESQVKNGEDLQPIIPIIFYHGQTEWKYRTMDTYFEGGSIDPGLRPFLPNFTYWLTSLEAEDDQWIMENFPHLSLRIGLLLMKHIGSPKILNHLSFIFEGAEGLELTEAGRSELAEYLLYLFKGSRKDPAAIRKVMDHETYMNRPVPVGSSLWQWLQNEKAEGKVEGKTEVAKNLLKDGISPIKVASLTGLPIETVEALLLK